MRRIALSVVGFLAVAGVIGYVVTNGGAGDDAGRLDPAGVPRAEATGGPSVFDEAGEVVASDGSDATTASLPGLPEIGPSVVRTAQISIEVEKGGFTRAFNAASIVAGTYGGYVESSSMAGAEVRSGELLIRIPGDRFDEAMEDLRGLGTIERQSMSGQDVTSEFVDLQARLRTWQAQESVLLELMAQADSIEATLRVQRELQDVQLRIEQIKGQLRVLQNRTDLATIQVSLYEAGAPALTHDEDPTRPSLAEAWRKAIDGFLGVTYAVVVGLGYLIPLTLLALLAWVGYRRFLVTRPEVPPVA